MQIGSLATSQLAKRVFFRVGFEIIFFYTNNKTTNELMSPENIQMPTPLIPNRCSIALAKQTHTLQAHYSLLILTLQSPKNGSLMLNMRARHLIVSCRARCQSSSCNKYTMYSTHDPPEKIQHDHASCSSKTRKSLLVS